MRIDAHHHLWQFDDVEYDWIDDSMAVLKQDFILPELTSTLRKNNVDGSIVVQARQSLIETNWLLALANQCEQIKGVVGWIDLTADDLASQLKTFAAEPKLVGFRHVIQGESDPAFMKNPDFIRGLQLIAQHGYKFDLLIFAHQLELAAQMLAKVPALHVVIDHIAKPEIKQKLNTVQWRNGMAILAENPNTYCKLSGLITEADWQNWQAKDFDYYLATCHELFGNNRLMFGSDWPVCLVAGEYSEVSDIINNFCQRHAPEHTNEIFGLNACRFYQLS
jgi:L-fuconolactonase